MNHPLTPIHPIECDDALLLAAAAAERTLVPADQAALDGHVAGCERCRDATTDLADEDDWVSVVRLPLRAVARGDLGRRRDAAASRALVVDATLSAVPVTVDPGVAATALAPSPPRERDDASVGGTDLGALPIIDPSLYVWGETIGQGGMGRVIAARDRRLGRPVAIKELLSNRLEDRFDAEALITAQLQHPSIVDIHEAGRWPSGELFYTMKLVTGSPLSAVIRERKTLIERIALLPNVMAVIDAIAYAHSQQIIHRDLKPSNVVLGPFGETVVIDWGLAKNLRDVGGDARGPFRDVGDGATQAGVGTPQYMPPEQARGDAPDQRVDVYALGATLYHVIDGTPPFGHGTAAELLARLGAGPPPPIATRQLEVPPDLAAIVDKAMARQPADRYPDAKALGDDLRRFQAGQLVGAFAYSTWTLIRRWVKRHRAKVIATAAVMIFALIGAGVSVGKILAERRRTEAALVVAQRERAAVLVELGRAELLAGKPMRAAPYLVEAYRTIADARTRLLLGEAMRSVDAQVMAFDVGADVDAIAIAPGGARVVVAAADRVEIHTLGGGPVVSLTGHTAPVTALDWSADGQVIASGSVDNSARRWGADGAVLGQMLGHGNTVRGVTVRADGTVISSGDDGTIRAWDGRGDDAPVVYATPAGWQLLATDGAGGAALIAMRHDDGSALLSFIPAGAAAGLAVATNQPIPDVAAVGDAVAALATGSALTLWHDGPKPSADVLRGHSAPITQLRFTRDGKRLLSGDASGALLLWDVERAALVGRVVAHEGAIGVIAVDRDGTLAASGGAGGLIRVWRIADLEQEATFAVAAESRGSDVVIVDGQAMRVRASSASGDRLLRARGETLEVWDPARQVVVARRDGISFASAFAPDGGLVATSIGEDVVLWDAATGADLVTLRGHSDLVTAVTFDPVGELLVTASRDQTARVWSRDGSERAVLRGHAGEIEHVAVAAGVVICASFDGTVQRWRLDDGTSMGIVVTHAGPVAALAVSPDGARAASASDDGTVRVWRTADQSSQLVIGPTAAPMQDVAFSPDGALLAVAANDGVVELWDVERGVLALRRTHRTPGLQNIAFTADGRVLVVENLAVHRWTLPDERRVADQVAAAHERVASWALVLGRLLPLGAVPGSRPRGPDGRVRVVYDMGGATILAHPEPPDGDAAAYALRAARTRTPIAVAIAEVDARTVAGGAKRAVWLGELVERYADVGHVEDAIVASERLRVDASIALPAVHEQRSRLAVLAGDPERAVTESIAGGATVERLAAMAKAGDRTFTRSQDDRHGRAALVAYRMIVARGAPTEAAAATASARDLERRLALPRGLGGPDKHFLRAGLVDRVPAFTACYVEVLEREPATRGTLQIQLTIGGDGRIRDAYLSPRPGDRGLAAVSRCVDRIVRGIVFPRMRWAPIAWVVFPLVLAQRGDAH